MKRVEKLSCEEIAPMENGRQVIEVKSKEIGDNKARSRAPFHNIPKSNGGDHAIDIQIRDLDGRWGGGAMGTVGGLGTGVELTSSNNLEGEILSRYKAEVSVVVVASPGLLQTIVESPGRVAFIEIGSIDGGVVRTEENGFTKDLGVEALDCRQDGGVGTIERGA
ncbi:hypothetical protein MA16_Dca006232 [Dendrobium catenatum]|uniref:Uncharacterized protein n=1 Tax=Dendrobium catenatum TaxID=906689 RepID=A0A2I0W999_9ASPA|nr:hypothetical protein MA16_Dca006232 [Dendrobium catenatum]